MKVIVALETAGRRGKEVTVIKNIQHNPQHIEKIAKKLKGQLGTGGTVKGRTIEIQGNHVDRVKPLLEKEGFTF